MKVSWFVGFAGALWLALCLAILYFTLPVGAMIFLRFCDGRPGFATANIALGIVSLLAGWAVGRHALRSAPGRAAAWNLLCLTLAAATTLAVFLIVFSTGLLSTKNVWQGWIDILRFTIAILPQPFLLLVGSLLLWVGPNPRRKVEK